jgi:hypothetical protein
MTMSRSGRWIYMLKNEQTLTADRYYLAVFETAANRFLPHEVTLDGCRQALFYPLAQELTLDVVCIDHQAVREITIDPTGLTAEQKQLLLSKAGQPNVTIGAMLLNAADSALVLWTRDWQGLVLDRASRSARKIALDASPGRWIRMQAALVSETGTVAYFGTGQLRALQNGVDDFDQIVKADVKRLTSRKVLVMPFLFYSMCLSADGNTIYTVSPDRAMITAVDARALTQIATIPLPGTWPIFAMAGP